MKQYSYLWLCLFAVAMTLTSCDLAEGIFKAGMYTSIIIIVIIVAVILWIFSRFRRRR
jgi:heme/copper-type cytochrome/quinol oxidase subunit 2